MDSTLILLVIVVIGVGVVVYLFRPSRTTHGSSQTSQAPIKPQQLTGVQVNKIKTLALQNKKLEAVKLYRQYTNASLLDAKNSVERM